MRAKALSRRPRPETPRAYPRPPLKGGHVVDRRSVSPVSTRVSAFLHGFVSRVSPAGGNSRSNSRYSRCLSPVYFPAHVADGVRGGRVDPPDLALLDEPLKPAPSLLDL